MGLSTKRIYKDLAAYLADTGITQQDFAKAVGSSQAVVSRLVNHKPINIPLDLALRISKEARIPLESLTERVA